jgi:hypothetical protein
MGTANTNRPLGDINWAFWVVLAFLVGLLFFSYPPLRIVSGDTRLLRPDWILALPLFGYFIVARREVKLTGPVLLAFLFVLVAAISFFVNPVRSTFDFLTLFLQLVFAVGLFTVLANMELDRETFIRLLQVWVAILVVISVYAMYEIVAINLDLPFSKLYDRRLPPYPLLADEYYRPVAMFSEPGFLSSLLATGVAILLPPVATGRNLLFSKWTQRILLVLITVGVLVSVALSGYVTVALSVLILVLLPSIRKTIALFWVLAAVLGLAGFVGLSSVAPGAADSMTKRIDFAIEIVSAAADGEVIGPPGSIGARWVRFMSGIEAVAANPSFGVGLGQFPHWVENATLSNLPADDRYGSLHGGYIQVISQTGVVGIVAFIGIWVGVIRKLVRGITTSEGDEHTLALVCTCMVIFMLVGWSHSFGMIHTVRWGMLGLFYGYVTTG